MIHAMKRLACLLALLSLCATAGAATLDTSPFGKMIPFTISGYAGSSTLENFPVLVRLSTAINGFDYADFGATAADVRAGLRFVDADGSSLDYEIDTWDPAGESLVWVSVPAVSGTMTRFYAYFKPDAGATLPAVDPTAVWTRAGYFGVWHFGEVDATDGSVADATGNGLTAAPRALSGAPDSETAKAGRYKIVYNHADEWYRDQTLVHTNSMGTALKLAFVLLKEYEDYPYFEQAVRGFEQLEEIYGKAREAMKPEAAKFAMTYKDDVVWNVMSSGAAWEVSYSDAFCFFQEMQTVHCVPIHSGEYFHGAFETTDKDLAILLWKSVGRTRPVDERAERFLNRFAGHHWIVDAKELGLDQIDEHVAEYFNASLMHPISKQMIAAMGDVRMHPMTYRRYMWKFEY